MLTQTTTLTQKGQVTVPVYVRQLLGLQTGSRISFIVEQNEVKIAPAPNFFNFRGSVNAAKPFDLKKMRKTVGAYLAKRHAKTS